MKLTTKAFSLVEVVIALCVLGILATLSVVTMDRVVDSAKNQKLKSDCDTLNRAVMAYIASGGDLSGLDTPEEVLVAMKRKAASGTRTVGLAGATIDSRIQFVLQSEDEARSGAVRIDWKKENGRFEISDQGDSPGIVAFTYDHGPAIAEESQGERKSTVLYSKESSWIWDYQEAPVAPPTGPSVIPVGVAVDTTPPATPPATPPGKATALLPPGFSVRSGSFPFSSFNLSLTLSDPNPAGSGIVYYSIDYGNWAVYGGPISVPAGAVVSAQTLPASEAYTSSEQAQETYRVQRLSLSAPSIQLSASEFTDTVESIQVRIDNPNPSGVARIAYAIAEPGVAPSARSLWSSYSGEFVVNAIDFPAGFTVHSYARAVQPEAYIDSASTQKSAGANFTFSDPGNGQVLYVIDASGSMMTKVGDTTRFRLVQDALIGAINRLRPTTKFNVVTFAGDIQWTNGALSFLTANVLTKQTIIGQINLLSTGSGTNYEAALQVPLQYPTKPTRVYFLTDGEPTGGGSYADEVAALAAAGIKVNTIGVDLKDVGKDRLGQIAAATGGVASTVSTN